MGRRIFQSEKSMTAILRMLRRWEDGDAENLYEYNKQERVVTLGELTLEWWIK